MRGDHDISEVNNIVGKCVKNSTDKNSCEEAGVHFSFDVLPS